MVLLSGGEWMELSLELFPMNRWTKGTVNCVSQPSDNRCYKPQKRKIYQICVFALNRMWEVVNTKDNPQ